METTPIPTQLLADAIFILNKYQARYHGAEHAQKDWDMGNRVLKELKQYANQNHPLPKP